ncbi:N-formylglutamate deformylase [Hyphococcus sp.]|uniref:N-formylglutamate deformylase n=1 Tax=Hyphococcus sp. TaxID=2038636 RepID=UPI003CCB8818
MKPVTVIRGRSPVILGQPHSGVFIPHDIEMKLNDRGRARVDTDWHVDRLYDGLLDDATVVRAEFHRYVIDANRDPSGKSLYPGQNTTGLVPLVSFENTPIWNEAPPEHEIEMRRSLFHAPYHSALSEEIERVKALHGVAVLYDCHSIRSELPFLFDGRLPDLNVGDNNGATCAAALTETIDMLCARQKRYSHVVNGRFRGGWTTRHYGEPDNNVHAVQMELAQQNYLKTECAPFEYDETKASHLRSFLQIILQNIEQMALHGLL